MSATWSSFFTRANARQSCRHFASNVPGGSAAQQCPVLIIGRALKTPRLKQLMRHVNWISVCSFCVFSSSTLCAVSLDCHGNMTVSCWLTHLLALPAPGSAAAYQGPLTVTGNPGARSHWLLSWSAPGPSQAHCYLWGQTNWQPALPAPVTTCI